MTAEPDHRAFIATRARMLAAARSNWLDGFSCLEIAVLKCAKRLGADPYPRGMPFSQRLSSLKSLGPNARCSKETAKKLQTLVQECQSLLPTRATLVHSIMQTGRRSEADVAFFQNVMDAADGIPTYMVITEAELMEGKAMLRRLAERVDAL